MPPDLPFCVCLKKRKKRRKQRVWSFLCEREANSVLDLSVCERRREEGSNIRRSRLETERRFNEDERGKGEKDTRRQTDRQTDQRGRHKDRQIDRKTARQG